MNNKIWIAITDDFELKGEGLGSVYELQYKPSLSFMNLLDDHGIKASFFLETMQQRSFLNYSKKNKSIKNESSLWEKTVKTIIDKKVDIQLHIHPQWFRSRYDGKYWELDKRWDITKYKTEEIDEIITGSVSLLEEKFGKKVVAFRAGSWAAGPPSKTLLKTLEKNRIKIDSSVVYGVRYNGEAAKVNYGNLPCPYYPYYPDYDDVRKISKITTPVVEIPVQAMGRNNINYSTIEKIKLRIDDRLNKLKCRHPSNLDYTKLPSHIPQDPFGFAKENKEELTFTLSSEHNIITLKKMIDFVIKKQLERNQERSFVILANHTKDLQRKSQFTKLKKFIQYIQNKYKNSVQFVTIRDMANNLSLINPIVKL